MQEFEFKVNISAVVRVLAANKSVALKIVPTVLEAPSIDEIKLANENNDVLDRGATVTDVSFSVKSIRPF